MIHVTDIIPPAGTAPDDWPAWSWFAVWDQLVPLPCDLGVGGEVILVRPDGLATWRTEVTEIVTFPFEHVRSALDELSRRWNVNPIYSGPDIAPGVLVAWRANPTGWVGRPVPDVSSLAALVCARCAEPDLAEWLGSLRPGFTGSEEP